MQPIVEITDPDFISKMDQWYKSTNYQKEWLTQILIYLSYFMYWCCHTDLKVQVNSTIYNGHYYYATDYFMEYIRTCKQKKFRHGYPLSISNVGEVRTYQQSFDDTFYFVVEKFSDPIEFVKQFNKNLYFKYDDGIEYHPEDPFFKDAIEKEIEQLFLTAPVRFGR